MLEVTQASISIWGADRVGARIAPSGTYGSMSDSDRAATFGYLTTQLGRLGIAYLHVVESRIKGPEEVAWPIANRRTASAAEVLADFDRGLAASPRLPQKPSSPSGTPVR
jgi:N-ethylmaleimide reductase